jgi:predicted TIM-barrel fold metal-dependent hydrolase
MTYKIISADSHMCEPPHLWTERIDKAFRDRAPRVVKDPDGKKGHFFVCEDLPPFRVSGAFAAGRTFNAEFMEAGLENALPGGWDPAARLKDMELDGVQAEVLYTTCGFVLFWLDDGPLQEACFRVYNDWLAEFCVYDPKRFAGLGLISLYDVENGRKELERCKKLGLRGAMIWASPPEDQPYGAPVYEPFWAAAQELEMPLSLHLVTGKSKDSLQDESDIAELYVRMIGRPHEVQHSFLRLVFTGVLERFPRLKIVSAEADIAWVPHLLERADKYFRRFKEGYGVTLSLKPSEYFQRQMYATFIDDPMGLKTYGLAGGADHFMWSTDYPHQASTFPHTQAALERAFRDVPEDDKRKITRDNASRLYGLPVG